MDTREEGAMMDQFIQRGQGLIEYALILVFIAIVVIIVLTTLGPAIGNAFSTIVAAI